MSHVVYLLRKLKQNVSFNVLILIYYGSIFYSLLMFGIRLWGGWYNFLFTNEAVRIIMGLSSRESYKDYCVRFKITTLLSLYIYSTVIQLKKIT